MGRRLSEKGPVSRRSAPDQAGARERGAGGRDARVHDPVGTEAERHGQVQPASARLFAGVVPGKFASNVAALA